MKKLIAIIIIFVFIFEGAGYSFADTIYNKTILRKPLDFSRRRFSPVYLCQMLAETLGQSMQKTMRRNIEINQRGALDIGVIYTEFTPQKLLRETVSEKAYDDLMRQIAENKIGMDIDIRGDIWVYHEPSSTYFIINKTGTNYHSTKREFYKATGRLLEPVQEAYPNEITVYDRDGKEVVLTHPVLLSKEQQGNYFIIYPAKNNIKLVSFEYNSIIEKIVNKTSIEELIRLFRALKSKGLKIAITTTNPEVLNWLRDIRVTHPKIDNLIDYCHVNKDGADIGRYVRELVIRPDQIMHISASHAGVIHKQGFISLLIAEPSQGSVHEIMRKEVDAVMIGIRNIDDIIGLISNWMNIREEIPLETAQAAPSHFEPEQILSRYPELESDVGLREIIERIKANPNDLIALNRLAAELIKRERARDSIEACLYLLGIISERRIEPKGQREEFLDRAESITMETLVDAYSQIGDFDKAIEIGRRLIQKYPKYISGIKRLMTAYIRVAKYDEAIEIGERLIIEFPKDTDAKGILSIAYYRRAERKLMLGEEYKKDYLKALSLNPEDRILKDRMVGLCVIDRDNSLKTSRVGETITNINTGTNYILIESTFKHILLGHSSQRYQAGLERTRGILFPEDIDDATIKELIIGAMRYGVNLSRYLPWRDHRMLIWYVKDNDPDLAARTGVSRIEVLIDNERKVIITGYPTMGERILLVNKYGYRIDPRLNIISSGLSDFIWNTNSRSRVQILAGDSETEGLDRAISNDSIFGKMELIWRECVIRQALWKGRLIGYQEIKDSYGKKGYLEFYRYDIPDEFVTKYSLSNKTIYVCVDYSSRRLIDVRAQKPRIDHETLGRTSQIYGKRIIDVEPIDEDEGKPIMSRDSLEDLVEEPLLEACRILYDKNIETISTSANKRDLTRTPLEPGKHYAYITINFTTLFRQNKNIIYSLAYNYKDIKIIRRQKDRKNKESNITIYITITENSTVEEVSKKAIEIANSFEKQRMRRVKTWTLAELQEKHRVGRRKLSIEELEQRFGYYYDLNQRLFYPNKEIYEKVREGTADSVGPIKIDTLNIEAQRGALPLQDVEVGAVREEEDEPAQTLTQPKKVNITEIQKPPVQGIPREIKLTDMQIRRLRKNLQRLKETKSLSISNDDLQLLVNAAISNADVYSIKAHISYLNRFSDSVIQIMIKTVQDFMKEEREKQERTQREGLSVSLEGVEMTRDEI